MSEYWERQKPQDTWITFRQYVQRVMGDLPRRQQELETLVGLFGEKNIQEVADGTREITSMQFVPGYKNPERT